MLLESVRGLACKVPGLQREATESTCPTQDSLIDYPIQATSFASSSASSSFSVLSESFQSPTQDSLIDYPIEDSSESHATDFDDTDDTAILDAYRSTGYLLDDFRDAAFLVEPLGVGCPIVGATRGFSELTGHTLEQILGKSREVLLHGVPSGAISRSTEKDITNYLSTCQMSGMNAIGEIASIQPNARKDGSHFVTVFLMGLCWVGKHGFVLGVQVPICEGLAARSSKSEKAHAIEKARSIFMRIKEHLRSNSENARICDDSRSGCNDWSDSVAPCFQRQVDAMQPDFTFFSGRLQCHSILVNDGYTAIRRESHDIATHCLNFGDRPIQRTAQGLAFTVCVDEVTTRFIGLPLLGFTKRRPVDDPGLYPDVTRCMGSSVLVGACGEAFARDQHEHLNIGFKPSPVHELQSWKCQDGMLPPNKRARLTEIRPRDMLRCVHTWAGHIMLWVNDEVLLDFDVNRPIEDGVDYYAVVDVCLSAASLTIMRSIA